MLKYYYLVLAFVPFIACDDIPWLNLTDTLCFAEVLDQCTYNTKEIIFYKGGSEIVFTLDADGALATYNHPLFNKTGITTVFIHGYVSSPTTESSLEMIEAYSHLESTTNFLLVNATEDYGGDFLNIDNYMRASKETVCVGEVIAGYLAELRKLGIGENLVHLIGHSLGGQTMHSAGQKYIELTGVKVRRITGLDPAGPCFDPNETIQLNSNDATHVDIIHTNSGVMGTTTRLGHANFIPNGGAVQEGCSTNVSCSHNRPSHYYKESVTSNQCLYTRVYSHVLFLFQYILSANSVTNVEQIGYNWDGTPGLYDADTNGSPAFCKGRSGINLFG